MAKFRISFMKFRMSWKRAGKLLLLAVFLIFLLVLTANLIIQQSSKKYIYSDLSKIPVNKVGMLLGCSKYIRGGQPNLYFNYRIEATVALYKAKKIKVIVVSGENSREDYNESQDMKIALMQAGIPENVIYLDYAGFRTLDSVVRLNKIFGQSSFTIISQKFHNERAVFIARSKGLNAVAYNAKDVGKYMGFKTKVREKFARVNLFVDMLTGKEPKFLGEPIKIE